MATKNATDESPANLTKSSGETPPAREKIFRKASGAEHIFRYSRVDATTADDEAKTVQVCFASEELVLRKATAYDEELGIAKKGTKYWELLSHRSEDADFSELDNGKGTVLDEHENSLQLGKVPRAKLSKDGVSRGVLKFDGLSELSNTRYEQMKRGERTGISTGYWHTKFIGDEGEKDGYPIKRVAWAADEISSVRNAADTNRAGVRRSADGDWACLSCGGMFARTKLDENYECGCEKDLRAKRDAALLRVAKPADFKFKLTRDKEDEVSFSQLSGLVNAAADSDKRFKSKRPNGDLISASYVCDIIFDQDMETWCAIIFNYYDCKTWKTSFTLGAGNAVTLGEAVEVKQEWDYVPVESERSATNPASQKRLSVDSVGLVNAEQLAKNLNPEQKMKLRTILFDKGGADGNGVDEAAIRSKVTAELEPTLRTKIEGEVLTRSKAAGDKLAARNKEIRARADEMIKTHGMNWAGKPGEVVVVGERIRAFEQEAYNAPADQSDSEVRMEFTRKADELIRGSRAPKNQEEAANLDTKLASRCSLRRVYNQAAESQARGDRTACFMPKDGAEAEADKEIRNKAQHFPGGMAHATEGFCLPMNMPGYGIRGSGAHINRLTRDALAGDFPTAGALIAPEYKFPTIEILRNKMALGRAGITILGGVIGNLVLPRQTGATQSQSLAEGAILAAYDQTFDQIRMTPHRIGSKQIYSRLALLQTTEDFEALVLNDHMAQNALWADAMILNGSGAADQPLGLLNQPGIGSIVFNGVASTAYNKIIGLETLIRKANIDEPPTYITTSTARGTLRITPATLTGSTVVSGSTNALWVGEQLVGRDAVDSQQVPNDILVALVGRHVVMAQWGGWQVVLDTLTLADADKIKLSMNTYIDGALRHPQAVARSADSLAVLA